MCRKLKLGQSPQKGKCDTPGPWTKKEPAPWGAQITPAGVLPGGPAAGHEDGSTQGWGRSWIPWRDCLLSVLTNCCMQSSTCLSFRNLQQGHNLNFSILIIKKSPYTLNYCCLLCWQVWEIRNIFQDATQMLCCNFWAVPDTLPTLVMVCTPLLYN